jgi:hydrogenase maturation protein HypF
MHPEYLSTKYALDLPGDSYPLLPVQHHHAHIASCMAENNILDEKVIGVAFDGLGYGDDETLWGGEFLVCDFKNYSRAAHLAYLPMPGGSTAIKEPWRMACAYLYHTFGENFTSLNIEFTKMLNKNSWKTVKGMISKKVNSPLTSSTGRLFDAVSAMLNIRHEINYEGEAAIELEQTADSSPEIKDYPGYEFDISRQETLEVDAKPLIRAIVNDLLKKIPKEKISAKFHHAVTGMILQVCKLIKGKTGLKKVVLSGGVFQNMILLQGSYNLLTKAGFEVYFHSKVPANDGGISLGQAVVANFK